MVGSSTECGRFAPSPTGPLHVGSLVAALGSFLEARRRHSAWRVRIEDVDTPRVVPGAADGILHTLARYGLEWDGPVLYQSQRREAYQAALDSLLRTGQAYPCSCRRRDLNPCSRSSDGGLIYPGYCRSGCRDPDRPASIRLRVPDTLLTFQDAVQGDYQQCLTQAVGDFVICRADGIVAYQLAVVVDDAAQGVSHIVRGSDLLDSTPRQGYLQTLLGYPTPTYAHLPVALGADGHKLSKQTGARPLDCYRPGPLLWAALDFLGQSPPRALQQEAPETILHWAWDHWRLDLVPRVRSQPWKNHLNDVQSKQCAIDKSKTLD